MEDGCDNGFDSSPENDTANNNLLRLLSRTERREIISFYRNRDHDTATVDELAEYLVERRHQRGEDVDREKIEIELYHIHLPRLAEHGIVEYDPRRDDVRYRKHEEIEALLDRLSDD